VTCTDCYGDSFTLCLCLYFKETILWASTICYGYRLTFLYVNDVRTSQETRILASTTCYGDNFLIPIKKLFSFTHTVRQFLPNIRPSRCRTYLYHLREWYATTNTICTQLGPKITCVYLPAGTDYSFENSSMQETA
jgi:hypothetical protein